MVGDFLTGIRIHAELSRPLRHAGLDRNWRCFHGAQCSCASDDQFSAWENAKYYGWILWCYGAYWCCRWGNIRGVFCPAYALEVAVLLLVRQNLFD